MEKLYTVKELAILFNVDQHTIYVWIKEGRLKSIKIGRMVRVRESDLQVVIESSSKNREE